MPGGGAGALDVDHDHRQLHRHREPIVSALRSMPGPLVAVTPRWPPNAAPSAMSAAAISSSAWTVRTPNCLWRDERVQQLRCGRDRIAGVEELQPALHARGDQAERERGGAVDVAVGAGRRPARPRSRSGRRAARRSRRSCSPRGTRRGWRRLTGGCVGELLLDPVDRRLGRAAVHPGDEAEREQVLGARRVARGDALDVLGRAHGHASSSARGRAGSRRASRPRAGSTRSRPSGGWAR